MRTSYNTSCEKSNSILRAGADAAGVDMPLLGGNLSSSSSAAAAGNSVIDGAQIISCRGKCSSSLSLYRAAKAAAGAGHDHQFFEASSSRHDVRRSASVSYRTVYSRELQPPPPRSVRHVDRRFREHATTASSSWSGSDTTLSFRVDSVRGLTRIVGWPLAAAPMYSELAAAGSAEEEEICTTKGENHAEAEEEEYNDGTERQRFQQLQDLGVAGNYQVRKKLLHMTNLSQSCRMVEPARDQFQWRRASARYGSEGPAVVRGKLRTLSSRATMGSCCNENSVRSCELVFDKMNGESFELLQSHADHESSTLALSPPARFKRSGGGAHRKKETSTHCKKRVDHEWDESRTAAAANKLDEEEEEEEDRVSSGWEITTTVASPRDHREFATRSSTVSKSQLGAMFATEGGACPSPESSVPSLAAVPFNWEDSPGKPKMKMSAAAATHRSDAHFRSAATRATSKNQEIGSSSRRMELESLCGSAAAAALKSKRSSGEQQRPAAAVGERSHRYYDQTGMESKSLESIATGARSSRFLVSQETHIDLVAPAAAKFLTHETTSYLSPFATPPHYAFSSPLSVPFKWEETPGKPKADAAASTPNDLQLPPRLAPRVVSADVPQQQTRTAAPAIDDSGGGDLRAQYCLTSTQRSLSGTLVAFFFSPCLTGACSRPCPPDPRPRQQAVAIPLLRHSSWSSKVSKSLRHKRIQLWSPRSSSSSVSRSRRHCRSSAGSSPNCQEDQSSQIIKQPKVVYEISHLSKRKYIHSRSAPAEFSACRHCSKPAQKPCLQTTSLQPKQESQPWTKSHKKVVRLNSGGVSSHKGEAHGHTHHRAGVGPMMSSSPTSTLHGPEPESLSQTSASNPSLSGYLDALTLPESSTDASCPPSSHASFESLEQQHQQEEEEEDQETRRTSLSPRSNGFNIIPDFAARLSAPATVTTARHNLTPLLPFSCTSCTSISVPHEKLLMSCNGTDQEEELCPFPPAIANAGSLPSPANTDAALDSPSPANAAAAAVAADMSPLPGNAAPLDALLLANADTVLSIEAGLDLSSSSANAAAWDLPSSEAGVDLMEVQNCQALGGCQVLGSTRWRKVRHHRVYFIISMYKVLKRVLFRQQNQKVELKQCYHNDICLMEFAIHKVK
ncbi:hypothetical protein CY35_14G097300 [Sphagnum magellanicum]|nr:hypothetical protein CY35_14G097300 [Sphagnum magellanicum]